MMTASEAADILGINQPHWAIRNMHKALQLHSWSNTPEEYKRLLAAQCALRNWAAFQRECTERRNRKFRI